MKPTPEELEELRAQHGHLFVISVDDDDDVYLRMPKYAELTKLMEEPNLVKQAALFRACVVYPDRQSLQKLCFDNATLAIAGGGDLLNASGFGKDSIQELDPESEDLPEDIANALVKFADRKGLTVLRHTNAATDVDVTLVLRGLVETEIARNHGKLWDFAEAEQLVQIICVHPTVEVGATKKLDPSYLRANSPGAFVAMAHHMLAKASSGKKFRLGKA